MTLQLPDFPWDSLEPFALQAKAHPGGLLDLSVGSPVDPTPSVAIKALEYAAQAPSYPLTAGSQELRSAMVSWWQTQRNTGDLSLDEVIPSIGSKEMVGLLPTLLGLGAGDVVVIPEIAYPTYAIGAMVAGATVVTENNPEHWPVESKLVWINSPSNPTGEVLGLDYLRKAVSRARSLGAVLASDECYAQLHWDVDQSPSLLDERVTQGDRTDLLALYSLSKQSNLAGYRAGLVAGGDQLIAELLLARKHMGLIVPSPIQAVMSATLGDADHVDTQRERYRHRRTVLATALRAAGFRIDHSEAGLYLWVTKGQDDWEAVSWFSERGILVAPGSFYGVAGSQHVRVALTATDEAVSEAAKRLQA